MKKKIFNYATNKFENLNAEDDLRPPDVYEINEALNKYRRKDDQIKEFIQLLYYAYRETFADPQEILSRKFFGPAHLRALHLIESKNLIYK